MRLLKDGKQVIASNLCGIHIPINGMYVAYSLEQEFFEPDADYSYFNAFWKNKPGCGYARVPITSTQPGEDGKIVFTAMITDKDFIGQPVTADTKLTTATLVHLNDIDRTKDLFVYSTILKNQIKIVPGTCIVVNVGISIGD